MWAGCPHPAGRNMRLPHVIPFNNAPLYYLTACAEGRRPILANGATLSALSEVWLRSGELDGWYVGRFMLMPDHVHFFAMPVIQAKPPGTWNKMWKSVTARRLAKSLNLRPPIWQKDTFDHILRGVESYQQKWDYVRMNPVRAGLCAKPEDWPWQGEINDLRYE